MPRPDPKVIPFRPKQPRKWTRPEDFVPELRQFEPKPPRPPKRPRDWARLRRVLLAWALILAVVLGTVAFSLWG